MNGVLEKPTQQANGTLRLSEIHDDRWVLVLGVCGGAPHSKRLNEMGLIAGTSVHVKASDGNGGMIVQFDSSSLAIDRSIAADVQVVCTD